MTTEKGLAYVNVGARVTDSIKLHVGLIGVLTALLLAVRFVPNAGAAICVLLAIHALKGAKGSFEALSLLAYLLVLGGADIGTMRWLVLFAAFGRTIWDGLFQQHSSPPLLLLLYVFAISIAVFSLLTSAFPVVSLLKLGTFVIGTATVVTVLYRTSELREYWVRWLFTMGIFLLIASIPMYVMGAGYVRNGVGFQGITSHPQTFGAVLAPVTAFLTGLYLFEGHRSKLLVFCMALGWFGMYMSLARTSLLATILGLLFAVAMACLFKPAWRAALVRAFSRIEVAAGSLIVVAVLMLQWAVVEEKAVEFLLKDGAAVPVTNILEDSRGNLMNRSMANFRSAPITGIGFGIPSDPQGFDRKVETGFLGLPTGASVEKGFMPTAVLEETGVGGAILVILLLVALFRPIVARGSLTLVWIAASCVFVNFGEMVFFSVGGMGFYFWTILGFCYMYASSAPVGTPRFSKEY